MKNNVCIIKIGSTGNLLSVERALALAGANVVHYTKGFDFSKIDKIVLPGVGNFKDAMSSMEKDKEIFLNAILSKPTLGICLGMQVLAQFGFEDGESKGLGLIDGEVIKMNVKGKLPHLGWNCIIQNPKNKSPLFKNFELNEKFYFMHSYEFVNFTDFSTLTSYNNHKFVSSLFKGNLFGVQFHPEKSGQAGLKLFRNFLELE